jgi:galactose mutarotase-like enzyme
MFFTVSPVTATQQQARDNLQQQLEQQLGQSQIRTQTSIQTNQPQTTLQTNVQQLSNQNTNPQSQPTAAAAPQQKKGLSLTVSQDEDLVYMCCKVELCYTLRHEAVIH